MAKDVFVSYSTHDKDIADKLCMILEELGLDCWIAPRDIPPGAEFDIAILDAIDQCLAMVVILTPDANVSVFVKNEVNRAFSRGKAILTFRVENIKPAKALEFYLARHQWTDGFPPPVEERIARMARALLALVGRPSQEPTDVAKDISAKESHRKKPRSKSSTQSLPHTIPLEAQSNDLQEDELVPQAVIRVHCLEVPQKSIAHAIAAYLGVPQPLADFNLNEDTGDIVPNDSYLQLNDGSRISISWESIHEGVKRVAEMLTHVMLSQGFRISAYVVKGFKERWNSDRRFGRRRTEPDDPVLVLLEKLNRSIPDCTNTDLALALEDYAYNLPADCDRSFLNALPKPSPAWDILFELVDRKAYDELVRTLDGIASLAPGIGRLWAIHARDRSKDRKGREIFKKFLEAFGR